jgi:hypothetical protein
LESASSSWNNGFTLTSKVYLFYLNKTVLINFNNIFNRPGKSAGCRITDEHPAAISGMNNNFKNFISLLFVKIALHNLMNWKDICNIGFVFLALNK